MQFLELPGPEHPGGHPFFVGAQYHPELTSRPLSPQPMFMGLVAAAIKRKHPDADVGRWVRPATARPKPNGVSQGVAQVC
jgi:CTP synthase